MPGSISGSSCSGIFRLNTRRSCCGSKPWLRPRLRRSPSSASWMPGASCSARGGGGPPPPPPADRRSAPPPPPWRPPPAPRAADQRPARLPARARQGVAARRLAEVQQQRRAGQVALAIDHLENPEQVEVEAFQGWPFMRLIHGYFRII